MKLEQQVVSLELSKQLKEAGYKQEGLHWWVQIATWKLYHEDERVKEDSNVVAPTVAELGNILSDGLAGSHLGLRKWYCSYTTISDKEDPIVETTGKTEADARAKMWLYLKKEKPI